uniref:Phospholipase A2-like protein n=1 Tax=Ascaris suum TaxID=6253 RepID=F1LEE3_ASCSU
MFQQRWFLIGQLLFNVGNIYSLVSLDQWQCGANNSTKEVAYISVKEDCPDVMDMFNECCILHDTCYADQLGKSSCDEQFCACMNNAALKAKQPADCKLRALVACLSVQTFGDNSYAEAARKPHSFNRLTTSTISSSTTTVNNLENIRWTNILFAAMMVVIGGGV